MSKVYILFIFFFLVTGCDNINKEKKINIENSKKEKKEVKIEFNDYKDENDIKFSIYRYINNKYEKVINHNSYWVKNNDISYYTFFYSNENIIYSNDFKNDFNNYKEKFKTKNSKHGFNFQFKTIDGDINKTIINPDDVWEIFPYIQIYLYDDIYNSGNPWYSHTEQNQVNNDTIFTTFKITMGDPNKILSNIKVTAFTYDTNDDFKNGNYIGKSFYTFELKKL